MLLVAPYVRMTRCFIRFVYWNGGRTLRAYPARQIVIATFACLTWRSMAPGVRSRRGKHSGGTLRTSGRFGKELLTTLGTRSKHILLSEARLGICTRNSGLKCLHRYAHT